MTKENADKFYALYKQHQAIAKRLAELDAKSEDVLINGLSKIASELGLVCSVDELRQAVKESSLDVAGGGPFSTLAKWWGLECSVYWVFCN